MSQKYTPKVGDRVRIVIEGEVTYDGSTDISIRASDQCAHVVWTEHVVSVEKVAPPLPTTPGSVVWHNYVSAYYFLTKERGWVHEDGGPQNCNLGDPCPTDSWKLIHDAGAAK